MEGRKIYLDCGDYIYGIEIFSKANDKDFENLHIKRNQTSNEIDVEFSSIPVYKVTNLPGIGHEEVYLGDAEGVAYGQDVDHCLRHAYQYFITAKEALLDTDQADS